MGMGWDGWENPLESTSLAMGFSIAMFDDTIMTPEGISPLGRFQKQDSLNLVRET